MQYVLPLTPSETNSSRRVTTLHLMLAIVLCGIGAGCFVLYWFTLVSPKFTTPFRPFAALGITSMLIGFAIAVVAIFNRNWLMQGKRSHWLRLLEFAIVGGASITFALAGRKQPAILFGVIAAAVVLATIWELRKPVIPKATIDENGITLPRAGFSQLIRWSEIENVLLRYSILSIELIGNRLIQRSIPKEADLDVPGIERFSKAYIEKYEKERAANAAW